jgi:hypothetical protein
MRCGSPHQECSGAVSPSRLLLLLFACVFAKRQKAVEEVNHPLYVRASVCLVHRRVGACGCRSVSLRTPSLILSFFISTPPQHTRGTFKKSTECQPTRWRLGVPFLFYLWLVRVAVYVYSRLRTSMEVPAPPQLRSADAPSAAATTAAANSNNETHRHKGGSLHDRLLARYHDTIERFKVTARRYNSEVDAAQQVRVEELHSALVEGHKASVALLAEEQRWLAECVEEWQPHEDAVQRAAVDDVLSMYADLYHPTPDEQGRAKALSLMKQDRLRIVRHLVDLHDQYRLRMNTIAEYLRAIEGAEDARRRRVQDAVRDLMASLTRIAVTSTTESQVLAQRILHHTNEQLGQNYLAMQTLATQLRQRELWRHQEYQQRLVAVYRETQEHMVRRHITWAVTVLRSNVFRRPEGRLKSVHAASELIAAIRKEAEELVSGLTEVVRSLQFAQPSTVTADTQVCGGSGANGWLRSFQPSVHRQDVFAGEDPRAVLEEAQMRASILVRHCRARCNDFSSRLRAEEDERAQAAAALASHACHDISVIATPLGEEGALLQAASLSHDDVEATGGGSGDNSGAGEAEAESVQAVDFVLHPLTQPHAAVLAMQESLQDSPTWSPCVPAIVQEGQWFVWVVSRGLREGCKLFCDYTTTSNRSMLVHLEGATDLLLSTATTLLGAARAYFVQWHEEEMDYKDSIAELERQLHALEEQLRQDETPAAAEARYAAGIACLQSIADAHTRYYEDVRDRVAAATSAVLRVSQDCVRELTMQLGLALAPLVEEDSTPSTASVPARWRGSVGGSRQFSMRTSFLAPATAAAAAPSRPSMTASVAAAGSEVAQAQADNRPRVVAAHGEEFVEETAQLRFACMVWRDNDGSTVAGISAQDGDTRGEAEGSAAAGVAGSATVSVPEPGRAFQHFYLDLLPELQPRHGPLFLEQSEVQRWIRLLRQVLLEWGLQLQRQAGENWRLYTTALLADVQRRVADILRHHRRRPATLQADIYEARVRELADLKNWGEKVLARIAEQVSRVHTLQQALLSQPERSAADRTLLEERVRLMEAVRVASSANAMRTAIHRHDTLCAQYTAALADRCTEATQHLEQARNTIEAECARILRERAAELSGGDMSMELPADDPIQLRVARLRAQVELTLRESIEAMEAQLSSRANEIQSWKDEWAAVVERSTAELGLYQGVQEALSRLRAHVQTLLSASATEEAALAAGVAKVVEESAKAQATNTCDLAASLQALLRHDSVGGVTPSYTAAGVEELPSLKEVERAVEHALEVAKAEQRERVRGAPVCRVLAVLDDLRMPLYSRGCRLGLLAYAVEMWRLSPSHYVLPQLLGDDSSGHGFSQVGSPSRVGSARGGKRMKAAHGAQSVAATVSMGHTLMPLPAVLTLLAQVTQWTSEVKANAEDALRQYMEAFPGPLHRRLPGMTDDTEGGFVAAVGSLCQIQEGRVRTYADKAGPTYRQHVQELWNTLQGTPTLLAAALETEAAAATFARVEAVLRPWQTFHAKSVLLCQRHRGSAKLSLASELNSAALTMLSEAESERATHTEEVLQHSWSSALRELQDEAGLHVARCWTALYTFLHILSGLVTPQHLVATARAVEGGQHRGLRHLLELRVQRERAAAAMDASVVAKREPRLQETMPLHRADQPGVGGGGNKKQASKAADKTGGVKDAAGNVALSPLPWGEVELPGLPLNACAPLMQYNLSHPQTAVTVSTTAALYVPSASGTAASDSKGTQHNSHRLNVNAASTGNGVRKGRMSNSLDPTDSTAASANTTEMSIPLVVPRFQLALECVQLIRTLVTTVAEEDNDAARVLIDTFSFWERHEAQLRQAWALTIAELAAEHS